ncbi:hypothetical protein J5N97_008977 [Dioscorea zingiberensis]|uniref:Uncharacterized protein n=1 Tax=Dioscorea zingiberensis TaxID=325984 RepID=A0A9D5CXD0_9LILI|nr:hypothetical protein J5N97_008977 [Dioscorea zingiberensis]
MATMGEGDDALSRFEEATRNAQRLQLDTLRAILDRNAAAGYLQRHLPGGSLGADADASSFRCLVPLSSYHDYADLIHRIADGSESPSALSLDPLLCFFYSSGTSTMSPKMIPYFESNLAKASSNLSHQTSSALLQRLFPPRKSINKVLWFLYAGKVIETNGGFRAMPASAFPFQNKRSSTTPLLSMCVSPPAVVLGSDSYQQMYCHLLCGLRCSGSIDAIRAPYASGLIRAIHLLESKWEQLCNDIEFGFVCPELISDSSMREAVEELLGGPRPEIAKAIRGFCGKGQWQGILRELWPEARYIACVTTGSMEQYYPKLSYYAGDIPILCGDYFSSECSVGINMDRLSPPESTSFVIIPSAAYFEFLPFRPESPLVANETVDISGVEIGELYEIVVTTYRGLYRYRLGDIVKVVGFHNSSPKVKFVTRAPKNSSEIFTERDLMLAMENFQLMLNENEMGEVVEYAGYLDSDSKQEHLVVFVEIIKSCKEWIDSDCVERCCQLIEGCLGSVYKVRRASGSLGCLEVAIVRPGSFEDPSRIVVVLCLVPRNTMAILDGNLSGKSSWRLKSVVTVALTLLTSSQAILIVWSKRAGKYEYSVTTANFSVEALKCALSLAALSRIWKTQGVTEDNRLTTSFDEVKVYPIPAALYLVKNLLQYYIFAYVDAPAYQILKNLNIISTGVLYRIILKKKLSEVQWAAFILLCAGCTTAQLNPSSDHVLQTPFQGWIMAIIMALLSGFAGVYTEAIIKKRPSRNINVQNFWLYVFGMLFNIFAIFTQDFDAVMNKGFFHGYSFITVCMILNHALSGIAVSMVMKYADNIVKVYSTSVAMLLTAIVSVFLFGFHLSLAFFLGSTVVSVAVYLHSIGKPQR